MVMAVRLGADLRAGVGHGRSGRDAGVLYRGDRSAAHRPDERDVAPFTASLTRLPSNGRSLKAIILLFG